jgi:YidC/Oxa1 family membrane protein insertase
MEKRVLLAVFLSFLVLAVYQAVMPKPKRPTPTPQAQTALGQPEGSAAAPAGTSPNAPPTADTPAPPTEVQPSVATLVADPAARDIVVESNVVRAVFSNQGGVIKSWRLTQFADHEGKPIDLVPGGLAPTLPRPFSLRVEDKAQTDRLNTALFHTDAANTVDAQKHPVTLTFEYQDAGGVRAKKVFRIEPWSYIITFTIEVANGTTPINPVVQWGSGLGDSIHVQGQNSSFGSSYVQRPQAIIYAEGKVQRLPPPKILEQPTWQGDFPFAGIDDHYFLASLVRPGVARLTFTPTSAPMPGLPAVRRDMVSFDVLFAAPPTERRVFFGPKDFDVLQTADRDLVRAIHYGMFTFLAVPLLRSLKWINYYIGNYGWSIIVLTILINVAMFPLRHRSVVSMRRMQELQPQVKAIQDRYAKLKMTDPARAKQNEELMALYKQKGVNPASGCVPMLLTMPVLFAFYAMLSVAVEIRGEPFALWIHDLSQHDPYYITPVLMGASMLWQQSLQPVADPAQQKIMMLTPLMFMVFFLWAPSGLVLYWLVSNLLGIGQQYATSRIIGKPIVRQMRPPAERKLKQAGAGQTDGARNPGQ